MPRWSTGLLVVSWIARAAGVRPRNSQTSPVRVSSTASSRVIRVPGTDVAYAGEVVEGSWTGRVHRRGGDRRGDRPGGAAATRVHAGADPGAAARPAGGSGRSRPSSVAHL